jgi:hypothetical protein
MKKSLKLHRLDNSSKEKKVKFSKNFVLTLIRFYKNMIRIVLPLFHGKRIGNCNRPYDEMDALSDWMTEEVVGVHVWNKLN